MKDDPVRVLILRLSSLGDVVLASVVVEALQDALPDTGLFFLTKEMYAPVYDEDPRVRRVIVYPSKGMEFQRLIRVIRDVRAVGFNLVVDLHGTLRSRLIVGLSGAKRKVTWKKKRFARELMVRFHRGQVRPVVERYLECAGRGIGKQLTGKPRIVVSGEARKQIEERFIQQAIPPGEQIAIICPGARWETKQWREEGFARVADEVAKRYGYRIVLLGDVYDRPVAERVREKMETDAVNLTGELSLEEFVAAIDGASVVICNDSAPMHVAVARGIPVVAVFGPTHPGLGFTPSGERTPIIRIDVPCSPCSLHGEQPCWRERRVCMEDLTWGMVMKQIEVVLSSNRSFCCE